MSYLIYRKLVVCVALCFVITTGYSQNTENRTYNTAFATTPPTIDGLMNDDSWNLVEWSGGFTQLQPAENKAPSQETAFKILYDHDNIYLFIRAYDSEPEKISSIMSRRDNFTGDMVFVEIDSYFDKQTAFLFAASASGAKSDCSITDNGNNEDDSWNPIWFLKTSIDNEGWCAEMRIPLSQLRFGKKSEQVWGLQVSRHIYRLQERSIWQYIPKGSPGRIHLFGELSGINDIKPKRQIELMPYTVGRIERFEKKEGDPFNTGKAAKLSAGLDGKVAITNDFTLAFTVNPDFGQVEADPSEVNLTAFESYFSEQRPFFVEGKSIFQFQPNQTTVINNMYSDNLFYSRRIGSYPHHYPETADKEYVRMPESTTILGAMKISGKTKNGLSVGVMESLTSEEHAVIDNEGIRREEVVEPLTNYFVGRVKKDYNKGATALGGVFTAVNRNINTPDLEDLHKAAYTGGIDFYHSWKERTWYLAGNAEFSNVQGKPGAMLKTQRSSARYFQRPDARHLSVDSTLTSLSGYGGTMKFGKSSQKKLQFETSVTLRSPGLEFNDIGYMRSSDVIHHGTWVGYYIRNPFAIFNNFYLNTNYWMYWNFSGKLLTTETNINFNSQFKNRWWINGSVNRERENISTTLLRGGPSFVSPGNQSFNLNLSTDNAKKLQAYAGNYHGKGDAGIYNVHEYWAGVNYKPTNSIKLSLSPNYAIYNHELQYVSREEIGDDVAYIFANLDQRVMSFTFRLNYSINPELSVEYYGQPFVSAGKYTDFKEITKGDADRFGDRFRLFSDSEFSYDAAEDSYNLKKNGAGTVSVDNPDFNFRQFRSNMVLRWEYLPGSTLYLVWSQGRTSEAADGVFSYGRDMKNLFDVTPRNVFLVKLSYWFSL